MYAKRIIPCLDLKNGRVVKGTNFVNLRDAGDPVEAAVEYDRQNADELVLLDITASSDARNIMVDIVSRVANSIFIPFTVGGGFGHILVRHLPGHCPDGPAAGGHRQRGAVCVQNISSRCGDHTVPQLLARSPLGVKVVFMDL